MREKISLEKVLKSYLIFECSFIFISSIFVYFISSKYDIFEKIVEFSRDHEGWECDEIIIVSVFLMFLFALLLIRRWRDLKRAMREIKELKGIIPICSSCKKIRDDKGFWHQVDAYVSNHTRAEFSHGICPECSKKLYPEYFDNTIKKGTTD